MRSFYAVFRNNGMNIPPHPQKKKPYRIAEKAGVLEQVLDKQNSHQTSRNTEHI